MFIKIRFNGETFNVDTTPIQTVGELKALISQDHLLKLIFKGKTLAPDEAIVSTFIPTSSINPTILVLKTTELAIASLANSVSKHEVASKNYKNGLLSRPQHEIIRSGFVKKIEVLGEFDNHNDARLLLQQIRDDRMVKQIMDTNDWRIMRLIELHPLRDSKILGYNMNKGVVIALRLRTDSLTTFLEYRAIISTVLHELSHMVFGPHDASFHALDRELNRIYDSGMKTGTKSYSDSKPQALGGRNLVGDRRQIMADAAELRLTKDEIAMVKSCGSHL